jgi:1-acyl-sn-glycerol-3-phosphate acyltransferase
MWARRAVSIPVLCTLWVSSTAFFPLLLLLALFGDLILRRHFSLTRSLGFFIFYLWAELVGLALATWIWCRHGWGPQGLYLEKNAQLQKAWAFAIYRAGEVCFSFSTQWEEGARLPRGEPFLLLSRHASTADTVLPVLLLGKANIRSRFVMKSELLWDPCLDVVGHRLPNVFVRRGGADTGGEIDRVLHLAQDASPLEALVIFPEGTRYSPEKRDRLLQRLTEKGDVEGAALQRELTNTLSPLRGGPLALLNAQPQWPVVILAHTGLEGAGSFLSFLGGGLIHKKVRVWVRVHHRDPDPGPAAQSLARWWREVDGLIEGARALNSR